MSNKEIKITVSGRPKSGKSTIMKIIYDRLRELEFDNISIEDDETHQYMDRRIQYLKDKVNISIEQKQLNRDGTTEKYL